LRAKGAGNNGANWATGEMNSTRFSNMRQLAAWVMRKVSPAVIPARLSRWAIRTDDFLYIRNYEPDRWPVRHPNLPSVRLSVYGDIDNGPAKVYMMAHKDDPQSKAAFFELAFDKRPAEELYDLKKDPDQTNNVADKPEHAEAKKKRFFGVSQVFFAIFWALFYQVVGEIRHNSPKPAFFVRERLQNR